MSLARTLHEFRTRPPVERRLLLSAVVRLAWSWAMIRHLSLQRIALRLRMETGEDRTRPSPDQLTAAARIGRAVVSVAVRTPWRSACLEQALAAACLLQRDGIPGTLYLGVAKGGTQPNVIAAHAWLRCGDLIVTGAVGHERFAVVGKYHWG